jgi:hypothetical protein
MAVCRQRCRGVLTMAGGGSGGGGRWRWCYNDGGGRRGAMTAAAAARKEGGGWVWRGCCAFVCGKKVLASSCSAEGTCEGSFLLGCEHFFARMSKNGFPTDQKA